MARRDAPDTSVVGVKVEQRRPNLDMSQGPQVAQSVSAFPLRTPTCYPKGPVALEPMAEMNAGQRVVELPCG